MPDTNPTCLAGYIDTLKIHTWSKKHFKYRSHLTFLLQIKRSTISQSITHNDVKHSIVILKHCSILAGITYLCFWRQKWAGRIGACVWLILRSGIYTSPLSSAASSFQWYFKKINIRFHNQVSLFRYANLWEKAGFTSYHCTSFCHRSHDW